MHAGAAGCAGFGGGRRIIKAVRRAPPGRVQGLCNPMDRAVIFETDPARACADIAAAIAAIIDACCDADAV